MIVLTDEKHDKEINKLVKQGILTKNELKELIFELQLKGYKIFRQEIRYKEIIFGATKKSLPNILVDIRLTQREIQLKITEMYELSVIDKKNVTEVSELYKYLDENEDRYSNISVDIDVNKQRDINRRIIADKGYQYKRMVRYNDKGQREYVVVYVDIPELEVVSLSLNEAEGKIQEMYQDWVESKLDDFDKKKLPRATKYVEDEL